MPKTFVGARLRGLRKERGLSQASLAEALKISPSYLNQIEHDVRPLSVPVLLRITDVFGVDTSFFNSQDQTRLIAELREVTLEIDAPTSTEELSEVARDHPGFAQAMVALHRRYVNAADQLAQATDGRSAPHARGTVSSPHEEVRDFFYHRQNYFHEIDTAAEELTTRMRMHSTDVRAEIVHRLETVHDVSIRMRIDLGDGVLHRYDPKSRVLEVSRHLSGGQQVFKMAAELSFLECARQFDELTGGAEFTSDEARRLALQGLANYYAAAVVLPYTQFHGAAEEYGYDIERLSAFFAVSYETVAHRMSTLQRPNLRGVPLSFVRVDRAGNMSKRQSSTGFHFSASGGTCPLWNVYETFAWPGKILVQVVEMPDNRNYMWVARTVERRAARYGQPSKTFAIGLGCELRHAHRLVYARGLDLENTNATPIGAGCRVCERENCPQRAFPAIGRPLDVDEHRSTISPYHVR
ncbi:acetate metabolism transcriptional regulator RamB [Tsukamurella sp. 8F]|uniref:acetate metabolism transcriptional regulator RamB n=1 Tax=unclassified Tsukamurella TaxID=2633480 RepID=UPI0023B9F9B0|nr:MULTISPECIES: acetate metabolism transcriptional regulator RamB [unclassified Tsukamurella]MDF0528302.1 acetate metabolism transcriptional regulator RamB [Tsukamurella sp. 8J]MDF0589500.1 acetate metabolism transcriptional regulator RamB [Tsukamurella sp. 8F]